eukprot:Awhi_evm1s516
MTDSNKNLESKVSADNLVSAPYHLDDNDRDDAFDRNNSFHSEHGYGCFLAIMLPVVMIPLAGSVVQKVLDETSFHIVDMHVVDQNLMGDMPNALITATLEMRNVGHAGHGAQAQPAYMDIYTDGKKWGYTTLPIVDIHSPTTHVEATVAIYITNMTYGLPALTCPYVPGCYWEVTGRLVVQQSMLGTVMYYAGDLDKKTLAFEVPSHEPDN